MSRMPCPKLEIPKSSGFHPSSRILDVRPEEDFLRGHLRGAYNVPWAEIASRGFEHLDLERIQGFTSSFLVLI